MSFGFPSMVASATLAISGPAGASSAMSGFVDQVERALFTTCPAILHGDINLDSPEAVRTTGLRRAPASLETKLARVDYGTPKMLGTSIAGATISLSFYPKSTLCIVMFDGPERSAAYDRAKAKVAAMPGFAIDQPASPSQGPLVAETFRWQLSRGLNYRVTLLRGPANVPDPANVAIIGYTKD